MKNANLVSEVTFYIGALQRAVAETCHTDDDSWDNLTSLVQLTDSNLPKLFVVIVYCWDLPKMTSIVANSYVAG